MDVYESAIQSFIVKIWLEGMAEETGHVVWRGHITHVPSGRRRYLTQLDGILLFIAPYLESLGVELDTCWPPALPDAGEASPTA